MKGDFHVRFDGSGEGQVLPATLPALRKRPDKNGSGGAVRRRTCVNDCVTHR